MCFLRNRPFWIASLMLLTSPCSKALKLKIGKLAVDNPNREVPMQEKQQVIDQFWADNPVYAADKATWSSLQLKQRKAFIKTAMRHGNLQPRFRQKTNHSLQSTSTKTWAERMREDYNPINAKKLKDANDASTRLYLDCSSPDQEMYGA